MKTLKERMTKALVPLLKIIKRASNRVHRNNLVIQILHPSNLTTRTIHHPSLKVLKDTIRRKKVIEQILFLVSRLVNKRLTGNFGIKNVFYKLMWK